jgi:hypothetical protein
MNKHEKEIQSRLEAMPFTEARKGIRFGTLYTIGSPDYDVARSWLEGKETELRDERETETLSVTKEASRIVSETFSFTRRSVRIDRIIAITAVIIAVVAAREDFKRFISWLINEIKTP